MNIFIVRPSDSPISIIHTSKIQIQTLSPSWGSSQRVLRFYCLGRSRVQQSDSNWIFLLQTWKRLVQTSNILSCGGLQDSWKCPHVFHSVEIRALKVSGAQPNRSCPCSLPCGHRHKSVLSLVFPTASFPRRFLCLVDLREDLGVGMVLGIQKWDLYFSNMTSNWTLHINFSPPHPYSILLLLLPPISFAVHPHRNTQFLLVSYVVVLLFYPVSIHAIWSFLLL